MKDDKFEYFKKKVLEHLDKLEKQEAKENKELKKSLLEAESIAKGGKGLPLGTEKWWTGKNGVRYKVRKIAQGKWVRVYDSNTRGAKLSIAALKRKANACKTSEELMQLMLENKVRFSDKYGFPLSLVQELSEHISKRNDDIEAEKTNSAASTVTPAKTEDTEESEETDTDEEETTEKETEPKEKEDKQEDVSEKKEENVPETKVSKNGKEYETYGFESEKLSKDDYKKIASSTDYAKADGSIDLTKLPQSAERYLKYLLSDWNKNPVRSELFNNVRIRFDGDSYKHFFSGKNGKRSVKELELRAKCLPYIRDILERKGKKADYDINEKTLIAYKVMGKAKIDNVDTAIKVIVTKKKGRKLFYLSVNNLGEIKNTAISSSIGESDANTSSAVPNSTIPQTEEKSSESEAEKHANRSEAMKGNQNAKKDGVDDDVSQNGKSLTDSQIKDLLQKDKEKMNEETTTKERYSELFKNGVDTPIGKVKMGEHQYEKFVAKGRENLIESAYRTLKAPTFIFNENDTQIFVKSFEKSDGKDKNIISVVITRDGNKISISTHERKLKEVINKAKNSRDVIYITDTGNAGIQQVQKEQDTKPSERQQLPNGTSLPNNSNIPQTDKNSSTNIKKIRNHYEHFDSVVGNKKTITLPSGEKMKCHYKLVEAEAPTASHNEITYAPTENFPKNENGKNINDRDYQNDKDAQESVRKIASNFNSLALDSPPIVTKDGIVISGNNRTMSSKLAARNGTDKEYLDSLKEMIDEYGLEEEDLSKFKNPRLILEVDSEHEGDYTTDEFAKFNQDTKKTMNNVEKAVKLTKTLNEQKITNIANSLIDYETMGELYADAKGSQKFVSELIQAGIIGDNEKAQYLTSDGMLNDTGKDFVETVLVGSVLNEDNIRRLDSAGGKRIRQKLVRAILPLIDNKGTGKEYSFNSELNDAVEIAVSVAKNHDTYPTVKDYLAQGSLFGDKKIDDATARLAEIIHDEGEKKFTQRMKDLNAGLRQSASGVQDIFLGGVETKESLMKRFLEIKKALSEHLNYYIPHIVAEILNEIA